MRERDVALLREEKVVIQLLGESLVKLDPLVIEAHAFGRTVVRPDDGRVAAASACPQVALFEHCDLGDATLARLIGVGETMDAASDDYHIICPLELGLPPHAPGLEVIVQRHPEDSRHFQPTGVPPRLSPSSSRVLQA